MTHPMVAAQDPAESESDVGLPSTAGGVGATNERFASSGNRRVALHCIRDFETVIDVDNWLEGAERHDGQSGREGCQIRIVLPGLHCLQHGHGVDIAASSEGYGPLWTFA